MSPLTQTPGSGGELRAKATPVSSIAPSARSGVHEKKIDGSASAAAMIPARCTLRYSDGKKW